jgi:Kinesin motor domain
MSGNDQCDDSDMISPNALAVAVTSPQIATEIEVDTCDNDTNACLVQSPMNNTPVDPSSCVQVAVRVRPLLSLEGDDECCVQVFRASHGSVDVTNSIQIGGSSGLQYTFDEVFDMGTNQVQVYESRVAPLIGSCLDGYNATILAYGQTGSGVGYESIILVTLCVFAKL